MRRIEDKNKQELEEYIQNAEMQKSNLEKNLDIAKERLKKIEASLICLDPLYGFEEFGGSLIGFKGTCGKGLEYAQVQFTNFEKVLYLLNLGKLYYQIRVSQTDHKEFDELVARINQLVGEMIEKEVKL